jgi:D-3-phosphoglycerate dehydrogenase
MNDEGRNICSRRRQVSHTAAASLMILADGEKSTVPNPVEHLILDLLEWIGTSSRPYAEVIGAWRTSCPRLPVWEEANDRGFIDHHSDSVNGRVVSVSSLGQEHLRQVRSKEPK